MNWVEQRNARADALAQFDETVTEQGDCLCVYCLEYADYAKPSYGGYYPDVWYQCLNCHTWTRGASGYCIYCQEACLNEVVSTFPKEPPPRSYIMKGTKLWARYRMLEDARKAKGIIFWEGNGYLHARFRHHTGKWFVLPSDLALAMRVMRIITEYARYGYPGLLVERVELDKIDIRWDAELAARHSGKSAIFNSDIWGRWLDS